MSGTTYEQAVHDLVLAPLGMASSTYFATEAMTRRFAVGHQNEPDGSVTVTRPWRGSRGGNPGGGLSSTVADLLRWAEFHLGDGRTSGGEPLLTSQGLRTMQQPQQRLVASALGDAVGISWFLRELDGVRLVGHGGSFSGHYAELLMAPDLGFAVAVLSNSEPNSINLNQAVVRSVLSEVLGLDDHDPEPLPYDRSRAAEVTGTYEDSLMWIHVTDTDRQLVLSLEMKPEALAEIGEVADTRRGRWACCPPPTSTCSPTARSPACAAASAATREAA